MCDINVRGYARAPLSRYEIVKVNGTHSGPLVLETMVQHETKLSICKQVVLPIHEAGHGFPADWGIGGTHPPVIACIFPLPKQLDVMMFHGPKSMCGGG